MRYLRTSDARYLAMAGIAIGLSAGLGCGSDTTGPSDATQDVYWALQLDHHAITLSLSAPSSQLQLHATPLTFGGDTILSASKVQYTSNDSSVLVDSTGLLTARLTSSGIIVAATLTIPNERGQDVTLVDTAIVNVNAPPGPIPVFTTLQITTPGDSAAFSPVLGMPGFSVQALDASNATLTGINTFCQSSNRNVVDYKRGRFNNFNITNYMYQAGTTTLTCSATVYGVSLADSLSIRVGMPLYSLIKVNLQPDVSGDTSVVLSAALVKIGVGGIIQWDNHSGRTVDLVFDDSAALQSVPASDRVYVGGSGILGVACITVKRCHLPTGTGNVVLPPANNDNLNDGVGRDFRKFTAAGTYAYHSATFPTITGTIVVQ